MLTRWNQPFFQDLNNAFAVINEFSKEWNKPWRSPHLGYTEYASQPTPRFHAYDEGSSFVIFAEVPGMQPSDLSIEANIEGMAIRGERKTAHEEGYAAHRQERQSEKFSKGFQFPCRVELDNIRASFQDGVLTIKVPKAPEAKPRNIQIAIS